MNPVLPDVASPDDVGAVPAHDKAGRDRPDIRGVFIAGKHRSHRVRGVFMSGVLLALLSGCKTHLEPASYSPDYQALTRADGRVELIPVECLKPSAEDQFGTDEEQYVALLPPGCANNLTLLQMVEQRSDLLQGRQTGPTMAAPVGRAAQVYIDGYDREELRRRQAEQEKNANTQEGR
jgi:hypothetical protein